MQYIKLETCQL